MAGKQAYLGSGPGIVEHVQDSFFVIGGESALRGGGRDAAAKGEVGNGGRGGDAAAAGGEREEEEGKDENNVHHGGEGRVSCEKREESLAGKVCAGNLNWI